MRLCVELLVRELTYRNPFGEELAAVDAAAGAVKRIANAREMEALGLDRRRNALIDHFFDSGQLDGAEAIAAWTRATRMLSLMFAANQPQLEQRYEPDDDRGQ